MTEEWVQQWLPFDFVIKEQEEKACKNPKHYEKPKTDNQWLMEYQYRFRNGNERALLDFHALLKEIGLKFINRIAQKNPKVKQLCLYDKETKADDAAMYMVEKLLKEPTFIFEKNIPGYLYLRILHELYYITKADKLVGFYDNAKVQQIIEYKQAQGETEE